MKKEKPKIRPLQTLVTGLIIGSGLSALGYETIQYIDSIYEQEVAPVPQEATSESAFPDSYTFQNLPQLNGLDAIYYWKTHEVLVGNLKPGSEDYCMIRGTDDNGDGLYDQIDITNIQCTADNFAFANYETLNKIRLELDNMVIDKVTQDAREDITQMIQDRYKGDE